MHDGNLGYVIRAAACFGAQSIHVIGSVPPRSVLDPLYQEVYTIMSRLRNMGTRGLLLITHARKELSWSLLNSLMPQYPFLAIISLSSAIYVWWWVKKNAGYP